ncbi:MAG: hypothetical protein JWO38_2792 [Gemmataceae bacterium]|nr:hypothetical protein [Gemmataceae bacterium]
MSTRASALGLVTLVALGLGLALTPARGQEAVHRHGFGGKQTVLVRGEANVRVEEKEHDVSTQSFKSQPSSEHVQLVSEAGTGDAAFVYYYYQTPQAPVSEVLSASVWVKATRPGVQLRARVVFPKEPDPARPEAPLTILVVGRTSEKVRAWDKLTIEDVPQLLGKALPPVRAKLGHDVNTADAYIDRLVLNVYTGPGPVDVWVDDLDIGPVRPPARPDQGAAGVPGVPAKQPKPGDAARGRQVEQRGGQLLVDGKAHLFRAIRHTGTPLHVLRAAGFDSLWLPSDAPADLIEEAGREGWMVIPSAPAVDVTAVGTAPGLAVFDAFRRKFGTSDVLFWDLGGGLTDEQRGRVYGAAAEVRKGDRKRPLGGDLWDGYAAYAQYLDVVGAHRWPLFTSLDLLRYRDWLRQRRELAGSRPVFWTWVQNHLPDWYAANLAARPVEKGAGPPDLAFADPVGPHPEQIRQLAYIGLACGCQGLGFWSDRYLSDSHQGRDRLQGMALLNTELDLLSPVIMAAGASGARVDWRDTSNPNVKAAVIPGQKGLVLLPIWIGPNDQYVPAQGAVVGLTVSIPTVAEGYDPWLVTPAGVECLRQKATRGPNGTTVTIDEFDMVAPVVFTNDQKLVVWWQDHARRYGRLSARWALDMAAAEYEKVRVVHVKLAGMGIQVPGADRLLGETHRFYNEAQKHFAAELYDKAYKDATRALRPLRVLMRDHWQLATEGLDVPTASPFAVSFFSLPQHWELAREVQASRPAPSVLPDGGFEPAGEVPEDGIRIDQVPGWSARSGSLETDRVVVAAGVVRAAPLADRIAPREPPKLPMTMFSPSRRAPGSDEGYVPPAPELGKGALKLEVRTKPLTDRDGKPIPHASALERTFLAVDSPPVRLPPGTLVRVSAWVKVPKPIGGTADGALFYDDAGGEPLAVRVLDTLDHRAIRQKDPKEAKDPKDPKSGKEAKAPAEPKTPPESPGERTGIWKHYHLYRRVPASGQISVTLALTGVGVAYFDDVRIEPLVVGAATAGGRAAPGTTTAGTGNRPPVVPAGYRPR